jgi:L-asparagine transporter-like permease
VKSNYLLKLSLFSGLLFAILFLLNTKFQYRFQNAHAVFIVIYLYLLTLWMHLALKKTFAERPQAFVYKFMGFSGLRLVLHFILLIVYWLFFKDLLVSFTVHFLILYLLFTAFEIYFLYKDLRQLPNNKQ